MQEHQAFISDEEHQMMEAEFDVAAPNEEITAIMEESVDFAAEQSDSNNNNNDVQIRGSKSVESSRESTSTSNIPISGSDRDDSTIVRLSKRKAHKGRAHDPSPWYLQYNTEFYLPYDHSNPTAPPAVPGPFVGFWKYNAYHLYSNPHLTNFHSVPTSGVRIDDLTISKVIQHFSRKALHNQWPADFDTLGMIRASRVPLGHAAKLWVDRGIQDIHGDTVDIGEEGYYYKFWRGLHPLVGAEGLSAGLYKIRPSYEPFLCEGFTFKKSFRAVIQKPEGYESDDDGNDQG